MQRKYRYNSCIDVKERLWRKGYVFIGRDSSFFAIVGLYLLHRERKTKRTVRQVLL
jgi:hypothetical protein